jgi:hypothetical protein
MNYGSACVSALIILRFSSVFFSPNAICFFSSCDDFCSAVSIDVSSSFSHGLCSFLSSLSTQIHVYIFWARFLHFG